MGQRINPLLFRLGITRKGVNPTFPKSYANSLTNYFKINQFIENSAYNKNIILNPLLLKIHPSQKQLILNIQALESPSVLQLNLMKEQLKLLTGLTSIDFLIKSAPTYKEIPIYSAYLLAKYLSMCYVKNVSIPIILDHATQSNQDKGLSIYGIKVKVSGRIKGIAKAKHITYIKGNLPLQRVTAKIDYSSEIIKTAHGTLGIKVWIYFKTSII